MVGIGMKTLQRVHEKNRKPIQIGDKVFASINLAAKYAKMSAPTLVTRIGKGILIRGEKAFKITKEEFRAGGRKNGAE